MTSYVYRAYSKAMSIYHVPYLCMACITIIVQLFLFQFPSQLFTSLIYGSMGCGFR